VARFTFNSGNVNDDVHGLTAKVPGTFFVKDRFGNENSAVFMSGNKYSYINLGTNKLLKPLQGTISFWVNLDGPVYSGKGALYNPFIVTKYTQLNDFNETYAVYYLFNAKRIVAVSSEDSVREVCAMSRGEFGLNKWEHIVISYDYNSLDLYLNGELQQKSIRKMPVFFLATDSVMIGSCANPKNERFLDGAVDDVEFYDRLLSEKEILALYHAPNPNRSRIALNRILFAIGFILLVLAIYLLIRYQLSRTLKREKQQLELINKLLENELRVIRASMNPHFIFNSLNGLQSLILKNENEIANNYLIKFSKLMRKVLESNASDTILLDLETELLESYIQIENLRFEEKITYAITVSPPLVPALVQVPIMMLQPFVENAIWHGLLKKSGEKILRINFSQREDKYVLCTIEDNGVGRVDPGTNSPVKRSMATLFIIQRLDLLNKLHKLHCSLNIEDKPQNRGTLVTILLPVLK
jgi:hypothetical protein